jgi:repressor LexA
VSEIPLTRRQKQILDFLGAYTAEHGLSPTLEEIAQAFGVNKVTIFGHVAELERKGLLERPTPRASRGLKLVSSSGPARGTCLPILGRIAAGLPIEAVEDPELLDLQDLIPPGRDVFALRVRGDSMIDDGIRDGDIVLVERRDTARNGETVVAVLEGGEATLKRFYKEGRRVRLQPANDSMEPLIVDGIEIRGVVLGVVRSYA